MAVNGSNLTGLLALLTVLYGHHISAQRLIAVAPRSVGVSLEGPSHINVSVTVIGGATRRHTVTLQLQENSGRALGEEETVVTETDNLTSVKIPLSETIIQEARRSETGSRFRLVTSCQTTTNHMESAEISTFIRSGFVFVHTDKPTYRRGETVHIRVLSADELLLPHGESLTMQIKDSGNVTKTLLIPSSDAIYEQEFVLHDGAISGDWNISVRRSAQEPPLSTATFRVAENTLYPFDLVVDIPNNIITNESKKITIDVIARESFGTPIFGQVELTIYLLKDGTKSRVQTLSVLLEAGKVTTEYALSHLYDLSPTFTFSHLLGAHLEVTSLVKDDSGRFRQVADRSCVFAVSEYELLLPRLALTAHPDVPYYPLQLLVRRYDDTPAANTKVVITVKEEGREYTETATTDDSGHIYRDFMTPTHISIVAGNDGTKKTNYSFGIIESLEPKILISPRQSEIEVGSQISLRVYRSDRQTPWFYTITSRGRVVDSGRSTDRRLTLSIDDSMVPHVNVFVWAVYGNVTVTDTATITVNSYCQKFTMDVFYKGQRATTGDMLRPGDDVTLEFTGDYHRVALRVVDSLVFSNLQESNEASKMIQNALKKKYPIGESLQVLGSEQAKSEYISANSGQTERRKRRSTNACPWSTRECGSRGRQTRANALEDCLPQTYRGVSPNAGCSSACFNAFYRACTRRFGRMTRSARTQRSGHSEEVPVYTPHVIVEHDPGLELHEMVRSDFRTSWLFAESSLSEMDYFTKRRSLAAHVPDSVTTWSIMAVGLDDHLPMCVAQTSITVKKDHFLKVFLPSSAKVGEEIEARVSVYHLNRRTRRRRPRVKVAHQEGLCNNYVPRRLRRPHPWSASWVVKPTRVGDFTVTVGYRKDVVRHTIRVQAANETGSIPHTNLVDVTSSSKILTTEELILLLNPSLINNEDDYYDYPDYEDYDYDEDNNIPSEDLARSASSRSQRETGTNNNIHRLHFTIRPKKTLSKWNISIELLTGFIMDEPSLEKLAKDNKDLKSYAVTGNVLLLFMNEMQKDSETVISFLLSAQVNVAKRQSGEIRIEHATLSGPVVVHRYHMDGSQPVRPQPVNCQTQE